jgi:hypothetical protein
MSNAEVNEQFFAEELAQAKYDLAWELIMAAENVPVKGDPAWVGWSAAVEMKGLILGVLQRVCREKGLDVPRR